MRKELEENKAVERQRTLKEQHERYKREGEESFHDSSSDSKAKVGMHNKVENNSSGSPQNSKQPSQKATLSNALQKANTAVLLDNAQNFEEATQAYSEACALLQQVMLQSSGNEDKQKLEAIVSINIICKGLD